jgi:FKBP-type peptidyl-prolyl cis-trans isomerase
MTNSFSTCFVLLALSVSLVLADEAPAKKTGRPPAKAKAVVAQDEAAEPTADDPSAPEEEAEKPAKKNGKKSPGIKITAADETELLKTLSYMEGYRSGKQLFDQFKQLGIDLDRDVLLDAFTHALEGEEPTMTQEEMKEVAPQLQKLVEEKFAAKSKEESAKNKREGEAFLAANKKKEGVKTLPSGLQYKVLKSGKGETPKRSDTVKAHYKGTFLNGSEFDSSYKRGEPSSFQIGQVIKGWTEALQLMKVGDKWQLFIPAKLAYEDKGFHDPQGREIIPPNATLVFEIELLGVEKGSRLPTLK